MDEQPDPQATTSFMQMVPFVVSEGLRLDGLTVSTLPWGGPGLMGGVGTAVDSDEPVIVLAYEWPSLWLRARGAIPKQELEGIHLRRFSADQRFASGHFAIGDAVVGGDPPDFVIETDGGEFGIDCTAFTVEERRKAHGLFTGLRKRIALTNSLAFTHLAGYMIYVWFTSEPGLGLPYRSSDEPALNELFDALLAYRPDPEQLVTDGSGLPAQAPPLGEVTTGAGATFYAVPFINAIPDTGLASLVGFELGLAYTTEHRPDAGWDEMRRLVAKHDKPGVDWLIVSAGAPNSIGQCFATEELLFQFLMSHPQEIRTPEHIRRVTVHLWSTGEAFELLPTPARFFGPLFQGPVPAHRPLAASQVPAEEPSDAAVPDATTGT